MHIFNVKFHKIPMGNDRDPHTRKSHVTVTQSQLQPSTLNLSLRLWLGLLQENNMPDEGIFESFRKCKNAFLNVYWQFVLSFGT